MVFFTIVGVVACLAVSAVFILKWTAEYNEWDKPIKHICDKCHKEMTAKKCHHCGIKI